MKILFFLEYYYPNIGGVETLFKSLIESLATEQHEITIITSQPYPSVPLKEFNGNISIFRIPVRSRYIFTFLGFFYLIRYIHKADFIHTTSYNAAIPAFFAGKLFGKKVVVTFHEVWDQLWFKLPMSKIGKWGHYLFEKFLLKLPFDTFIGVSKSTSHNLIKAGVQKNRVVTIYNGINYEEFVIERKNKSSLSNNSYCFTYFGRLGISKGLDLLIPAAKEICTKYPNSKLQLIIPKVPTSFLKNILNEINSSDLKNQTQILHELPFSQLKETLVNSNCVIIPSYSEGFCFAAAECVAMSVPIISSNQAALKEVVSGQHIKMEELSISGLVHAMEKAYEGKWEYTPAKKFELTNTIEQYKMLYQEVLTTTNRNTHTT